MISVIERPKRPFGKFVDRVSRKTNSRKIKTWYKREIIFLHYFSINDEL